MSKAPLNLVSTTIYGNNTSIDGLGDPAGGGTGKGRRVPGVEASERPFLQVMQEESIIRSGIEKDGYPEVKKKTESKMRSAAAKARKAARDKWCYGRCRGIVGADLIESGRCCSDSSRNL